MGSGAGAWYRVSGGAKDKELRISLRDKWIPYLCFGNGIGAKKIGKVKGQREMNKKCFFGRYVTRNIDN